ncbi:cytochrome B (plasmid) [Saccharobesus litoralis]|uniref:Cytochrome B n=1 Tax=Saccharobesus litoralis TaxID=2172099 RepID=A0A2S0VY88_9ALTE|nr:cytochrome b/b6 domain-containing protein [Saccharobesus litoralis]AWB69186.1 cytochrome B [Saccharobesus litoralis]
MSQTIQSQINQREGGKPMQCQQAQHSKANKIEPRGVLVWDLPVRVTHWLLVVMMIIAYATHLLGYDYYEYHIWSGYSVCVLVMFRMIWGIVGTQHARFINFIKGPKSTYNYVRTLGKKENPSYVGHNPLGALMVVFLLGGLLMQSITGLFANDEVFNVGPFYLYINEDLSLQLTSLHRQVFYWIVAAVVLHILAVLLHRVLKGEKLVNAMITGRKLLNVYTEHKVTGIPSSKLKLALAVLLVVTLTFSSLIWLA